MPLIEAEEKRHIQAMRDMLMENIMLYVNRIDVPVGRKMMLAEKVLVNTLASHVISAYRLVDWRGSFPTHGHFKQAFIANIHDRLNQCVWNLEAQDESTEGG